jgi:hypothetical protein
MRQIVWFGQRRAVIERVIERRESRDQTFYGDAALDKIAWKYDSDKTTESYKTELFLKLFPYI